MNSYNVCQVLSLASLLIIFLVECEWIVVPYICLTNHVVQDISTSYVDYIQTKPSAPPTLIDSVRPSRRASLKPPSASTSSSYEDNVCSTISRQSQQTIPTTAELSRHTLNTESTLLTESTPLLPPTRSITDGGASCSAPNIYFTNKSLHSREHSSHHYHHHHAHHIYAPIAPSAAIPGVPIDVLTNSPRICRQLGLRHLDPEEENERACSDHHHEHENKQPIGRRRQVVGLLVSISVFGLNISL